MRRRPAEFGRLKAGRGRAPDMRIVALLAGAAGRPFSVLHVTMAPGSRHAPILHARTTEFFLVLRGTAAARIEGRTRALRAGDFAYLPPGAPHGFRAGRAGVEALAVFCPPLARRRPDILPAERP